MRRRSTGISVLAGVGLMVVSTVGLVPALAGAAFPGTNGQIAFQSFRAANSTYCGGAPYDGTGELFLVNPSTDTTTQLTCTGQIDSHPFVSPDGSTVVFSSTRAGGSPQLYTVPESSASNTTATPPTDVSNSSSATDDYPSWSPAGDGTIIFQRTVGSGTPQLYTENVSNPSTTTAPVFSSPTGASDTQPVYDPLHANIIAFTRSIAGHEQIMSYNLSTPLVPPVNLSAAGDGGTASNDSKPDFAPVPGITRIVFQSDRSCGELQLYTMSDSGSNQVPVWSGCRSAADENPAYSPDAAFITFDQPGSNSQDVFTETVPVSSGMSASGTIVDLSANFATDDQPNWGLSGPSTGTPEAPAATLLPIAGIGVGGAVLLIGRRRRRTRAAV